MTPHPKRGKGNDYPTGKLYTNGCVLPTDGFPFRFSGNEHYWYGTSEGWLIITGFPGTTTFYIIPAQTKDKVRNAYAAFLRSRRENPELVQNMDIIIFNIEEKRYVPIYDLDGSFGDADEEELLRLALGH